MSDNNTIENLIWGVGFALFTLLLQSIFSHINTVEHKVPVRIWVGSYCAILICILGIYSGKVHYFSACIGYIIADEFGKKMGWHK